MSKNNRFKLPAAAYLVLIQDDSILLAKRKGSWKAGWWSLVAGHIDGDETMKDAIAREAYEEVGLIIKPEDLDVKCVMHRKAEDTEYFDVFLQPRKWEGKLEIREPDKIADLQFFSLKDLPDMLLEYVKEAIDASKKGISYIDHGW